MKANPDCYLCGAPVQEEKTTDVQGTWYTPVLRLTIGARASVPVHRACIAYVAAGVTRQVLR